MEKVKEEGARGGESCEEAATEEPIVVHATVLDRAVGELFDYLFEEFLLSSGTQFGRELRYGELEELGLLDPVNDEHRVNTEPGMNIFGQPVTKNAGVNFEIECPVCNRTLAAARFAQHLEKCMGMGRNSSRIAKRRVPATSTVTSSSSAAATSAEADQAESDADEDEEWTKERKKKIKKSSSKKSGREDKQ